MPLRDDLLNPIPGDNPSGVSLRYDKVYDQIKEARTEDDESIPVGVWQRQVKKADLALIIKLAGEALATRSKDLQLAVWLTEAHVKREGPSLIEPCFKLILDLQEQFWGTLYPEIEDGDPGMRASPIEWAANRVAAIVHEAAITKKGLNYYQYKESRAVGYEADTGESNSKIEARKAAIADGKITAEEFDVAFAATPKSFYVALQQSLQSPLETLDRLQRFGEEKYGDDSPSFSRLRVAFEEVGQVVAGLLNEKRKVEPDLPEVPEVPEVFEEKPRQQETIEVEVAEATISKAREDKSASAEPVNWDDAVRRIHTCALFMLKEKPSSPVAYLLHAAMRFGEMREQGNDASYDFLKAPSTETRQTLRRLSAEANWEELLCAAITAVGEPCGRAWLDAQRYVWKASSEAGYYAIAGAVVATLQSLLKDIPELPTRSLDDDTPTANADTQHWLEETVTIPKSSESAVHEEPRPEPVYPPSSETTLEQGEETAPDAFELARDMIRLGQLSQAIQLLVRDAAQQPSGRARFQRRLQIAQLCMGAGQNNVAHPVLEELVTEIEQRNLEDWEDGEMIAKPLALLLKCLDPSEDTNGQRKVLFSRLCRIDPIAAMDVSH